MLLSYLGLVLGLGSMLYLTVQKRWFILMAAWVATVVIAIFNGAYTPTAMWAFFTQFGSGMGVAANYLMIMPLGALFGRVMQVSGFAESIAIKFSNAFGPKYAGIGLFVVTALLTWGGISVVVAIFTIYPIVMAIGKKLDLPRPYLLGTYIAGSCTFTTGMIPGVPSAHNLIPTTFLGTTATAGAFQGIVASLITVVLSVLWLLYDLKRIREKGLHFTPNPNDKIENFESIIDKKLPPWQIAVIPLVICILSVLLFNHIVNAFALVSIGISIAVILTWIYSRKTYPESMRDTISIGFTNGFTGLLSFVAIVGLGKAMANTIAYKDVIARVINLDMNPYVLVAVGVSIICLVTGSSSGGLTLAMQGLSEKFLQLSGAGANLGAIHRIAATAGVGFDAMPWNLGVCLFLSIFNLSYKEGYSYFVKYAIVIPVISLIAITALSYVGIGV
ncbi:GntP family permease [Youngiibacter fragilis]|uniref:Citrate transporter n=1 Tax=Youngiibacter fragilis 232.1 TaxID=994573 RepID=V4EZY4_9CLOT|nr:GntP family permease [Youngiibacter fragilis]ETA81047.1 hypothetical protein T472_0208245 [Youngiibacter fragilis 232.1]